MNEDAELLRRYADDASAEAFAELVRRNLGLVYATALRHLGNSHRAQEVAQSVFVDLACKAGALRSHPALVSWLYTSTHYAALKMLRAERRRLAREQEAQTMHDLLSSPPSPQWEKLRPMLDDVMHTLGERDREILLLRYFKGLPFADVARLLQLNEGTARMRVDRALDKMNQLLARRGIGSTAAALGAVLAETSAVTVPAGLAANITGATLTAVAAGGASSLGGMFLLMSKLKFALASALVMTGLTTAVIELHAHRTLRDQLAAFPADDGQHLQQENDRLRASVATHSKDNPALDELAKARARLAVLKARPDGVVDWELRMPRNLGRETPAAAMETLGWAIDRRDLDRVATFFSFEDDTPENRAAFMAQFTSVVQARYRTAERLVAAALFGAVHGIPDPLTGMQIVSVEPDNRADQVRLKLWFRTASGREVAGNETFRQRADG